MNPYAHRSAIYPSLFGPLNWGVVQVSGFETSEVVPDRATIQSVNVVPFIGDRCVVVEVAGGRLTLPGGTRELGESLLKTAQRKLVEEAGATITSLLPLGFWTCHSANAEPWRPFFTHPDYIRLILAGEVELTNRLANPDGGEQIARVSVLDVAEAATLFEATGQPELADLYNLAGQIRRVNSLDAVTHSAFDAAMAAK
ncbi:MAG: NUDIX domain-containing protein [Thermomicrobiales bacterium]